MDAVIVLPQPHTRVLSHPEPILSKKMTHAWLAAGFFISVLKTIYDYSQLSIEQPLPKNQFLTNICKIEGVMGLCLSYIAAVRLSRRITSSQLDSRKVIALSYTALTIGIIAIFSSPNIFRENPTHSLSNYAFFIIATTSNIFAVFVLMDLDIRLSRRVTEL